jgi:hypothetical protein
MAVYTENQMKHRNTMFKQNTESLILKHFLLSASIVLKCLGSVYRGRNIPFIRKPKV